VREDPEWLAVEYETREGVDFSGGRDTGAAAEVDVDVRLTTCHRDVTCLA
jgi:hypothetical protein